MDRKWGQIAIALVALVVLTGVAMRFKFLDEGDISGNMGIELVVTYENGDVKTIAPETPLAALGLDITGLIGGPIAKLEPRIKYKANWSGDLHSWGITGYLKIYMDGTVIRDLKIDEDASTHTIRKGSYKELAAVSYTSSELEALAGSAGRHELKMVGYLILSITFTDGTTDAKNANHNIVFKFDYTPDAVAPLSMITEFSVQTYAYPTWE
jgi:hypothetical protein